MPSAKRRKSLADQIRESAEKASPGSITDPNEPAGSKVPLSQLWDEEPVSLDVFVQDRKFLGNPPLFDEQYRFLRHLEQVFYLHTYADMVEEFGEYWKPVRPINFAFAEWGKGAGKDHTCRVAATRIQYLLCCLKSPQSYFGMAEQDIIHTINVAATADQARRAFFVPLGNMVKTSPWFKEHILNDDISDLTRSIRLNKQLELISGHSQIESFEGLNLILAVADEISAFKAKAELEERGIRDSPRTAEAILGVLESSARTRFPKTFKVAAISYPRYKNDPIENLIYRAKKDNEKRNDSSNYLASGPYATWDIRSDRDREDFQDAFENNYAEARAKYECMPERSEDRFMKNDVAIAKAFPKLNPDVPAPLEIQYFWGKESEAEDTPTGEQFDGWQVRHILGEQVYPVEGCLYALHADLARVGDRAGVAMAHVRTWELDEYAEGGPDDRPIVKVDFIASYSSDPNIRNPDGEVAPREIQLRWFRQLVKYLIRQGFAVGSVTLDGWQSIETLQILETWGIECKIQSVDRNAGPYRTLKELIEDDRLEAYDDGIVVSEIEGLTRLKNDKIDHPVGGGKDESDAVCGAVVGALNLGGDEGDNPVRADPQGNLDLEIQGDLNPHAQFNEMDWGIGLDDIKWTFSF